MKGTAPGGPFLILRSVDRASPSPTTSAPQVTPGTLGDRPARTLPPGGLDRAVRAPPGRVECRAAPSSTPQVTHPGPAPAPGPAPGPRGTPAYRGRVAAGEAGRGGHAVTRGQTMAEPGLGAEQPRPDRITDHPHGDLQT